MKVSIILAAYNIEKYVQECLDSVLCSISPNDEVIIVDDGSTDSTTQIIHQAANDHKQIILHRKSNGGISSARNAGLALATGDYVIFADGDDAFVPETYRLAQQHLDKYKPDILVTDHLNWLNDGTGPCIKSKQRSHPPFVLSTERISNLRATLLDCIPCTWTRFIKRDLLSKFPANPFDENLMYDDLPLIPHITASANSLYYIPLPLIKYRSRPNSITKNRSHRSCTDMVIAATRAGKSIQHLPSDDGITMCADLMLARKMMEAIRQCREVKNPTYSLYREILKTTRTAFLQPPQKIYSALRKSTSRDDRRIAKHILFISLLEAPYIGFQLGLAKYRKNRHKK